MHCYRNRHRQLVSVRGVTTRRHGAAYPHEVLNRDADHPIMQKFGAAWANPAGELYWIEKVWPTAHPLAVSKNRENGNDEVCVWTNDYQGTRVFGTTLGHHNETVEAPEYLDLITRGSLWACDKLNDTYLKPQAAAGRDSIGYRAEIARRVQGPRGLRRHVVRRSAQPCSIRFMSRPRPTACCMSRSTRMVRAIAKRTAAPSIGCATSMATATPTKRGCSCRTSIRRADWFGIATGSI